MADKKMNQFPTASDVGYIYAETTSGEQVRISKADLAAVVAGLIGMSKNRFVVNIAAGETAEIPYNVGVFRISAGTITGASALIYVPELRTQQVIFLSESKIYGLSNSNYIYIWKDESFKLRVTNNTDTASSFEFKYL